MLQVVMLPSFHRPTNQHSSGDAYRNTGPDPYGKCHDHGFNRMPRQTLDGVIHKLFRSVAAKFCGAPCRTQALLERIHNNRCRPGSLTRCFSNLIARPFHHCWRHCVLPPFTSENRFALSLDSSLPASSATDFERCAHGRGVAPCVTNSLTARCRQLQSITVFLVVLASTVALGAQTTPQLPKATGVGDGAVQRAMTSVHPLATFRVGGNPDWMALNADSVWVTSSSTNSVIRLNAATNEVGESVTVEKPCSGLAVGFGSLWVPSCAGHNLVRIDLESRKVVARIAAGPANAEGAITTGAGSVWMVTSPRGVLARIDPPNNSVVARIRIPSGSYAAAFADGSVWITSTGKSLLSRVDPANNKVVSTTRVGKSPRFLTVGAGSVWTLNQGDGTISRVDTRTGKVSAVIEAGLSGAGGEIAYGEGSVWATLLGFPITRIDPATNKVAQQWTGKGGDSIRVGFGSVWLTELEAGVVWRIDPALQ